MEVSNSWCNNTWDGRTVFLTGCRWVHLTQTTHFVSDYNNKLRYFVRRVDRSPPHLEAQRDQNRAMTSANSARVCPINIDTGSLHLLAISCRRTESYFSDYSHHSLFRNFAIVLGFWNVGPSQRKRTPIVWPCGRIVAATQCLEGQNVLNLIYYKYRVVLTMLITALTSSSSCDLSSILGTTNLKLLDEFRRIHNWSFCLPQKSYLEGVTLRSNFPAGI